MTFFDIKKSFAQSHEIVRGFEGKNELAFDWENGRFVVLSTDAEKANAREKKFATKPGLVHDLILKYIEANPEFVHSTRIEKAIKKRAKWILFDKETKSELTTLAAAIHDQYERRLARAGTEVIEQGGTKHLLTEDEEATQREVFRMQCGNIQRGLRKNMRLIVEDDVLIPVKANDKRPITPQPAIVAAFAKLIKENARHQEIIAELEQAISDSSSPLAESLRSSITESPPLLSATPPTIEEEQQAAAAAPRAGLEKKYGYHALERQADEIAKGFTENKQLAYNLEYDNFVAVSTQAPASEKLEQDPDKIDDLIHKFITAKETPREILIYLRDKLRPNKNGRSEALIKELNQLLFEKFNTKPIRLEIAQLDEAFVKSTKEGFCLVWSKTADSIVALPSKDLEALQDNSQIETDQKKVLEALEDYLLGREDGQSPEVIALLDKVQAKLAEYQ